MTRQALNRKPTITPPRENEFPTFLSFPACTQCFSMHLCTEKQQWAPHGISPPCTVPLKPTKHLPGDMVLTVSRSLLIEDKVQARNNFKNLSGFVNRLHTLTTMFKVSYCAFWNRPKNWFSNGIDTGLLLTSGFLNEVKNPSHLWLAISNAATMPKTGL